MTEVEQQENEVPQEEQVEHEEAPEPEEAAAEDGYERQEEEEAPVSEPEPVVEEEPFVPGPLVISEAHENFTLDKKMEDDPTVGLPNPRHLIDLFSEEIIIPAGNAIKVQKEINLIQNTEREYDLCSTYWKVDSLKKFQNVEIHQMDDNMKYLCSLSSQSCILGFQIIEQPD